MMKRKTILIADDDNDLCEVIALRCRRLGLRTVVANDGAHTLQQARLVVPDLICLDIDMPNSDGFAVSESLKSNSELANIPIIFFTGRSDSETMDRCKLISAQHVSKNGNAWVGLESKICGILELSIPDDCMQLDRDSMVSDSKEIDFSLHQIEPSRSEKSQDVLNAIFAALGRDSNYLQLGDIIKPHVPFRDVNDLTADSRPWIIHVDDDIDFSNVLKLRLEPFGIVVAQARSGIGGVSQAFITRPTAIVLDYQMPHGDGKYVLQQLKECPETSCIPIIILTGNQDASLKQEMFKLGADAFLSKPVLFESLGSVSNVLLSHQS